MARLRYSAALRQRYAGASGSWEPGEEKDVEDAEATRLLASFPDWFARVASDGTTNIIARPVKPIAEGAPVTKPAQGKKK